MQRISHGDYFLSEEMVLSMQYHPDRLLHFLAPGRSHTGEHIAAQSIGIEVSRYIPLHGQNNEPFWRVGQPENQTRKITMLFDHHKIHVYLSLYTLKCFLCVVCMQCRMFRAYIWFLLWCTAFAVMFNTKPY